MARVRERVYATPESAVGIAIDPAEVLVFAAPEPRFAPRQKRRRHVRAEGLAMGSLSIWHWIIVIVVVLLLFGRGKISELMGDVAQGIKAFKKGMSEDEVAKTEPPSRPIRQDHRPSADRRRRPRSRSRGAQGALTAERARSRLTC